MSMPSMLPGSSGSWLMLLLAVEGLRLYMERTLKSKEEAASNP